MSLGAEYESEFLSVGFWVKSGTRRKGSETLDVWKQRGQLSHRMDSAFFKNKKKNIFVVANRQSFC